MLVLSFNLKEGKCLFPPLRTPMVRSDDDNFWKISAKCTNFEVTSLGLELQVSSLGLGVFDEVSVSSRNFNQVSVSEVTVSTTSLATHDIFCLECHGYNCPPQSVYDRAWQDVHNYFLYGSEWYSCRPTQFSCAIMDVFNSIKWYIYLHLCTCWTPSVPIAILR